MIEPATDPHARDERHVYFELIGDFDPDEVSRVTGLTPTRTIRKGTRSRPTTPVHRTSVWRLDSGLDPWDEFPEHLEALLLLLRPAWSQLCGLSTRYDAYVEAAIYCRSSQGPLVKVSPAHGAAIAELGATLGFDIYALPEEVPPEGPDGRLTTRDELRGLMRMMGDSK